VLCAGQGTRFGANKMQVMLAGEPVWQRSYRLFRDHDEVDEIVLVVPANEVADYQRSAAAAVVVPGGSSRQESALAGFRALPPDVEIVLVHDGARPFASPSLVSQVIEATAEFGAAAPGVAVRDTIRQIGDRLQTLDRSRLTATQTPQGGRLADFLRAHETCDDNYTDDLALLDAIGIQAELVPGEETNVKITTPYDLQKLPMQIRTGLGYDIHAFSTDPARPMWLGGVEFDERPGLEGHSDADALVHAVVDALLGAIGLGDIGMHYPNTDPQWKDRPSTHFLRETGQKLQNSGWEIVNIDATVIAERPKVLPRRQAICEAMASTLGITPDRVSVKATTQERLGSLGRGEGLAAFAVATVQRPDY